MHGDHLLTMIQVFIIGGDGTQKGAAVIYEVVMTKAQRSCICLFFFSPLLDESYCLINSLFFYLCHHSRFTFQYCRKLDGGASK